MPSVRDPDSGHSDCFFFNAMTIINKIPFTCVVSGGWRGYFRGRSQKPKKVSRCVWVNIPFKKDDRKRETSPLKGRRPFYRGPSFTKCSIPLRQDWVNVPPLPLALLIPPLPLLFRSDLLPWFIWWKEFCTGLWLWWYPYTVTFSPRQMFLSQNTVTFIPKSPYKHIKWSQHVYVDHGWQKWQGQRHECWGGWRADEEGKE